MKKIQWVLGISLFISMLVLGACGSPPEPEPTATPTAAPVSALPDTDERSTFAPVDLADFVAPEIPGTCEAYPLSQLAVHPETEDDWATGAQAEDAQYVIYKYSDFQCPGSGGMAAGLQTYLDAHPDVRLVYRHFPLPELRDMSMLVAEAAEAAGAQGKFWEMHDLLFAEAREGYSLYSMLQSQPLSEEQQMEVLEMLNAYWIAMDLEAARERVGEFAEELRLDMAAFDQALDEGTYTSKVQLQMMLAADLQLPGTPTLIFDDYLFPTDMGFSYEGLAAFRTLLDNRDTLFYAASPEMTLDVSAEYRATLQTSLGDVEVQLLPHLAPVHANSFIFLAQEGWYDGAEFFFVQQDFASVTGDPTNTTIGYPGYQCLGEEREFVPNEGLVWMFSNGQFFITLGPAAYEQLVLMSQTPAEFALLGEVVEGMDILRAMGERMMSDHDAPPAEVLRGITISQ